MITLPSRGPIGELDVSEWIGTPPAESLADLRGRVVAIEAFQMLCPGCVKHGLPQAQRLHSTFSRDDLVVIGLHTVFEHHDVMGPEALRVFLSEFRITFPVAVDQPLSFTPATMSRLALQGTPTLLLVDKAGDIRFHAFGQVDDLQVGAALGILLAG
jgi:hypothetical protein